MCEAAIHVIDFVIITRFCWNCFSQHLLANHHGSQKCSQVFRIARRAAQGHFISRTQGVKLKGALLKVFFECSEVV